MGNRVRHEQLRGGTCSSSLHFAERKAGISAVSLPSSSALTGRDRVLEERSIPQPGSRAGSTSPAELSQFPARLINTNWNRWGLTRQAANCSTWCMDVANLPSCRNAGPRHGNGEECGYLFAQRCMKSQSPGATALGHHRFSIFLFPITISCRSALVGCADLRLSQRHQFKQLCGKQTVNLANTDLDRLL